MREFIRRLQTDKKVAFLLLLSSLLANLLALSVPLFVTQIIGRFMRIGTISTLVTLVLGTLVALVFEYLLRQARFHLARSHMAILDHNFITGIGRVISESDPADLRPFVGPEKQHPLDAIPKILNCYTPQNLCYFLDLPFAGLFVLVICLIDVYLGLMTAVMVCSLYFVLRNLSRQGQETRSNFQKNLVKINMLMRAGVFSFSNLRLFISRAILQRKWISFSNFVVDQTHDVAQRSINQANMITSYQSLLSVVVVSLAAVLSISGELDVGALVGVNILAARAISPISRFTSVLEIINTTKSSLNAINEMMAALAPKLQRNPPVMDEFHHLELVNVSAKGEDSLANSINPLSAKLTAGEMILVRSHDDMQTRHFYEILTGLRLPAAGGVTLDGINIRQIPFEWLRLQIGLLPANPVFWELSVAENFEAIRHCEREDIQEVLKIADIHSLINSHPQGLDMIVKSQGEALSPEIKWRLGLARLAFVYPPILVVEDPVDNLDSEKYKSFLLWLMKYSQEGRLVIFISKQLKSLPGASQIITLGRLRDASQAQPASIEDRSVSARVKSYAFFKDRLNDGPNEADELEQDLIVKTSRTRSTMQMLTGVVSGLVILLGLWTYFGDLDRISYSVGTVVPADKLQTVDSLEGGIIKEIMVVEGQTIKANAPIMELQTTTDSSSLAEMDVRLLTLELTHRRLTAQISGAKDLVFEREAVDKANSEIYLASRASFESWKRSYSSDIEVQQQIINQRRAQIEELIATIQNLQTEVRIAKEQETISKTLFDQNAGSKMDLLTLQSKRAGLERELAKANSARETAKLSYNEAENKLLSIKAAYIQSANKELEATIRDYNELKNRRDKVVDMRDRRILRAPIDGQIKSITTYSKGAVIAPNSKVAVIVPIQGNLTVEANLPISEIGFVSPGQMANIRLASSDAYHFNAIDGNVEKISPDSFVQDNGTAFYKMTIHLKTDRFESKRSKDGFRLVPGLKVSCAVIVGKRSVFEYLADPILQGLGTVFRER